MIIYSLYELGELLRSNFMFTEKLAYAHLYQFFNLEVLININGDFLSAARIASGNEMTLIPTTVLSEGRTNNEMVPTPAALHDTLIHVAGDFETYFNINNDEHFTMYIKQLKTWCVSGEANTYIKSIL